MQKRFAGNITIALLIAAVASCDRSSTNAPIASAPNPAPTPPVALSTDPRALHFSFGLSDPLTKSIYTPVVPGQEYTRERKYGFEPGATLAATDSAITSDKPFFFSADVPEGNYRVTVTVGGAGESATTVKAELRRLMLENIHTAAGKTETRSFIVNVRTPAIPGGGRVTLKKPRESVQEAWAWDNRLTLEFNGIRPSVSFIEIVPVTVPTVFLLGDSTVCDQPAEPYCSWGQMITRFFKRDVAIANHSESGESVASSVGAHRIDKILAEMKPGDYLFVQFGHNDMKETDPQAPQKFKATLEKWSGAVKAKKGTFVLVTPVNRHTFSGDSVTNSLARYCQMMQEAAADTQTPLIDLNALSAKLYESAGSNGSLMMFEHSADMKQKDATHHSPYGAYELAKCVLTGIRQNELPLAKSIIDDLPAFDPSKPDPLAGFAVPASPNFTNETPLGN